MAIIARKKRMRGRAFMWGRLWAGEPETASGEQGVRLRVHQTAARLRNGASQLPCGLDPFRDDRPDVRKNFLVGGAIRGTPRKLWDFCDESLVVSAPVDDDLITRINVHRFPL